MSRNPIVTMLVWAMLVAWVPCATGQTTVGRETTVQVEFAQPEKFADVGDRYVSTDKARAVYLEELRKHIQRRASHLLSAGQKLEVTITDIDMAGGFEPWRRGLGNNVRVVRDVYPPRIDLNFRLTNADGVTLVAGERKLRDLSFLASTPPLYRDDPLRYEKSLLDDWLERELQHTKV